MADEPEVATKAPESDAVAPSNTATDASPIPGDTPAQTGPTMGDHCTTLPPLPSSHSSAKPAGELTKLNGVECYVTKPQSYPHSPGKLLLLLTGGTGVHSVNNQLQADVWSQRGYIVVMPDQFEGDPAPNTSSGTIPESSETSQEEPSLVERVKMGLVETAKSFTIDMWLARHTPEKVMPTLRKVLESAKEEFADAVANGNGVYGVGYCFGAKYILQLCGPPQEQAGQAQKNDEEKAEERKTPDLKAGSIAHGTLITSEDIENVKSPLAMVCVKDDNLFPDEIREQGKAALELNAVEHDVKVYDHVPHGFAVLGDYGGAQIQDAQKDAFELMANWLDKF